MHPSRSWRLAVASCLIVFYSSLVTSRSSSFFLSHGAVNLLAASSIAGTVVDPAGQPVPRAFVKAVDPAGTEIASTFTDESGRFQIAGTDRCQLHVSLTGFQAATIACTTSQSTRVVLALAPVEEAVVVTATRTEVPSSVVGASVTVFDANELARRQRPMLVDLLRTSPGATIVMSGGLGTVSSLFVRGGESNYNKVLLDGIPLNEPGGTFNFSNVTTEGLERVEIVRGAQSALFGSDAMASVVQLFTKRGDRREARPHASVAIEEGTYGTTRGDAAISGASGRLDYAFGVARLSTDNRGVNNAFDNTTVSANIGIAISDAATLRAVARGEMGHVGTPGQTAFGRPDSDAFFDRNDGVGGISFDHQLTRRFRQRAAYSLTVSDQQSTDSTIDPPYTPFFDGRIGQFEFQDFPYDSRTKLRRHHASYQADFRLSSDGTHGDHLLTVLADWDGERSTLEDRLAGTLTNPSRNNFGWSIEHQALWPRISITGGGRVEHNDSFGNAFVPRGSVTVVIRDERGAIGQTRVHSAVGLGIKEPTLLQSFSPSPSFLGNPSLQPERSRTAEAGVEQRFANDRGKVDLTWFDNRFKDLISTRTLSFSPYRSEYFNIGLTQARGLEWSIEVAPISTVQARAGYTFLSSEVVESTSPFNVVFEAGQALFRRPRHSGFVGMAWQDRRLTVDVAGVFVGSSVDSDFSELQPPLVSNPGHTTWDARVAFRLSSRVAVTGAVDNAANVDYMEPLGYPALRRAVRVGIRAEF